VERIRGPRRLGAALGAVTAAVVGVIASLALTFGVNILFEEVVYREPFLIPIPLPRWGTADPWALAIAVAAFVALRWFKLNPALVALGCGLVGLVRSLGS
jgi:chromate transporter